MKNGREDLFCSFCGRPESNEEVEIMIVGPNVVTICDVCVGHCNGIIKHRLIARAVRDTDSEGQKP